MTTSQVGLSQRRHWWRLAAERTTSTQVPQKSATSILYLYQYY